MEKVVATIDTPSSHQGILRPAAKNSVVSEPARLVTAMPITSDNKKKSPTIPQSSGDNNMSTFLLVYAFAVRHV
ncbi:MAG: hypothetical protein BWY09_00677 [Candidatus Hydrogenedentes bacterium ADurb.Bin179]|nr:MAG: hypothetical protein BWY09_00677 [Candidatus Hydrogenedentes bacterium ADurb.Bin179]